MDFNVTKTILVFGAQHVGLLGSSVLYDKVKVLHLSTELRKDEPLDTGRHLALGLGLLTLGRLCRFGRF